MRLLKGLYGESRVVGDDFIKEYSDKVSVSQVSDEFDKSLALWTLSQDTGLFFFPKPKSRDGRRIVYEKLEGFTELRDYLVKEKDCVRVMEVMRRLGTILGTIHNNLSLVKKESLGWKLAPQNKVFLYTDFGLANILIKDDDIILIDPSFNFVTDRVCLYDSFYFDLAYFKFQLTYLIPLKDRLFYNFENTRYYWDEFILGYTCEVPFTINKGLLKSYMDEVKKVYIKKYVDTLIPIHRGVWLKILAQEAED